ncbi:hypothetical protein ACJX0J_021216, partial [Zea mays]
MSEYRVVADSNAGTVVTSEWHWEITREREALCCVRVHAGFMDYRGAGGVGLLPPAFILIVAICTDKNVMLI